jgi:hypothetical protein
MNNCLTNALHLVIPSESDHMTARVDGDTLLDSDKVNLARSEQAFINLPWRIRDDLVDPAAVAHDLATVCMGQGRHNFMRPTKRVREHANHKMHGREGEFSLA